MKPQAAIAALLSACLCGCLFGGSSTASNGGGGWDDFPNRLANSCGDITPAQMRAGDSLVAVAQPLLQSESDFFTSDAAGQWSQVKRRDVATLEGHYARALGAAPAHCGALFGHAIATSLGVVNESSVDSLVRLMEDSRFAGGTALLKVTAEEAGPVLLKIKASLAHADKSLLTHTQEVAEQVLLPRVDSSIASLEKVMQNPDFRFDFTNEGRTYRLDRGEVGPLLAGLKFVKALLTVVAGYHWAMEADESYPYWTVLTRIKEKDLDSLSEEQKAALDHYTGLIQDGTLFTHIRPGWTDRVAAIPALLLQSIGHAQAALQYGIDQAARNADQSHDPYRVGTGEDADVDPADLRLGIERLERARKYLTGEVLLTYSQGRDSLRVDFPKFFLLDGLEKLLPYFAFHAYPEWNDTLPADTSGGRRVSGPIYFTDAAGRKTLEGARILDYLDRTGDLRGLVVFPDPTFGGIFPDLTNDNIWAKAESAGNVKSGLRDTCNTGSISGIGTCKALPGAPSDLDLLLFYLSFLD